jgi:hypothetical protein
MAGVKKQSKKASGGKNTALIIFMVFFFLTSVGLGVWGYYGYANQEALRNTAEEKVNIEKATKVFEEFNLFLSKEGKNALGHPVEEPEKYANDRDDILKDGGRFKVKQEKKKDKVIEYGVPEDKLKAAKAMVEEHEKDLGYDGASRKYKTTYKDTIKTLEAEIAKLKAAVTTAQNDKKTTAAQISALQGNLEAYWKEALGKIDAGNTAALAAANNRYKEFQDALARAEKSFQDKAAVEKEKEEVERKLGGQIKQLQVKLKEAEAARDSTVPTTGQGRSTDVHALLLDISKGKTLWDAPLGKITRLEQEQRHAYINIGSKAGLQPETTFMVFGAGWDGRAEKALKGTVEVIRILGEHSALCRITSLYDGSGTEIALADPGRGRPQREAENPLKEGDVLYNLLFGMRVAIAGEVNLTPYDTANPAEQTRNLDNFMALLKRHGVIVDAYIDLNNGKLQGQISRRTNYLVRGHDLVDPNAGQAPKVEPKMEPKEGEKDKVEAKDEKEPKEPKEPKEGKEPKGGGKEPEIALDRVARVNETIKTMRTEAIEKGLFIISPENLVNVVGYRRPRSANNLEVSGFRPSNPAASSMGFFQFTSGDTPTTKKGEGGSIDLAKPGEIKGKWSGKINGGKLTLEFQNDGGANWTVQMGADGIGGFTNIGKRNREYLAVIQGTPVSMRMAEDNNSIQVTGGMLTATLTKE